MYHVTSDPCYKGPILQRNYRSYKSFVKFHGKEIWEPQHDSVLSIWNQTTDVHRGSTLIMRVIT